MKRVKRGLLALVDWLVVILAPDYFVIKAENEWCRLLVRSWLYMQRQDKCWYYPEIFKQLCATLRVDPNSIHPDLPPYDEFVRGCCMYQHELYKICGHQMSSQETPHTGPPTQRGV